MAGTYLPFDSLGSARRFSVAGGLLMCLSACASGPRSSAYSARPSIGPDDPSPTAQRQSLEYLSPEWSAGERQSPINIVTSRAHEAHHEAKLSYRKSSEHVVNLGHTIEVDYDEGSTLDFDGIRYELTQFHFHTPSEHLLDGITYPMEIHLVHRSIEEPQHYLVVAALFKEGRGHQALERLLPIVPARPGERVDVDEEVDANGFFGPNDGYYFYEGSLTTPPYTEAVNWLVLDSVHEASAEQIETLNHLEGNNARHIQAGRSRVVDHCAWRPR